jgi:transcriptional regulator of acetoin/glycerol metabolism
MTKVNISTAARMVGVDRSTFYRHVAEKGITLEDKNTKRPKVDVSELIRVYGDKVKNPDQVQQSNDTYKVSPTTPLNTSTEDQIEIHTLREKVKYLESLRETEKRSLEDQIDLLKNLLESERAEKNKATALLTDQRSGSEKLASLEKTIKTLSENQAKLMLETAKKRGVFSRLFS